MWSNFREKTIKQTPKLENSIQLKSIISTHTDVFMLNTKLKVTSLEIKYTNNPRIDKIVLEYLNELVNEILRWKAAWSTLFKSLDFVAYDKTIGNKFISDSIKIDQEIDVILNLVKIFRIKLNEEDFHMENADFSMLFGDLEKLVKDFNTGINSFFIYIESSIRDMENWKILQAQIQMQSNRSRRRKIMYWVIGVLFIFPVILSALLFI